MEKMHQQQWWWRVVKSWLSFKNLTFIVCFFNIITALFLLHGFFSSSSSYKFTSSYHHNEALYKYIKESEEIRRKMVPLDLIRRVREIENEAIGESETVQQTVAVDLISRLNNYRSYSDAGNLKALEEWRKRKMERARQRLGKNGTVSS